MKYYKDKNGEVFAFESDGSQDELITSDMVKMTQVEIEDHLNPPKTPEQIAAEAKQAKIEQVSAITVTTTSGKTFDGNEEAQNRMARAVTASVSGDTTQWKLADNTVATITHDELKEALRLAGEAMTNIWVA